MAVQYDSKNDSWSTWISRLKVEIPKVSEEADKFFTKIKNVGGSMNYPGASPQASFATTAHPCLDASDTCLSPRSARSRKRGI